MRCSSCKRFVSDGEIRTDEINVEVDEMGTITLSGTLYRTCGECGDDTGSAEVEAEDDAAGYFDDPEDQESEIVYEQAGEAEVTATEDAVGKAKYYGVEAQVKVRRIAGEEGDENTIRIAAREQASVFEPV